jgi:lathosterol oxidase
MLRFLLSQSSVSLWLIFLAENFAVTAIALLAGWSVTRLLHHNFKAATKHEWLICFATNIINTAITYSGFCLWKYHYLSFVFNVNWHILVDFLSIFISMDLFMYLFHYFIHRNSYIYRTIHRFHHVYENPTPIDLFVLHPLETIGFGLLWLITISLYHFNFYAVIIYLVVNVIFGIAGHLGFEPIASKIRGNLLFKYLGTSAFHHRHHMDVTHNFGFYTNIWDKLFKTYNSE